MFLLTILTVLFVIFVIYTVYCDNMFNRHPLSGNWCLDPKDHLTFGLKGYVLHIPKDMN